MSARQLPRTFPDGTHYVIEGRPTKDGLRITSRRLIMPDGHAINLMTSFDRPRRKSRRRAK